MQPLSTSALLAVWERGQSQPLTYRLLLLLAAAWPELAPQALAELSLGRRDGYLLTLREWTFGSNLASRAACPACGEALELNFQVADIRVEAATSGADNDADTSLSLQVADYKLNFRLPNSLDLLALSEPANQRQQLLARCLSGAETHPPGELPDEVVAAVEAEMARVDPQADIQLALACPACGHCWNAPFDIGAFFWGEINHWALRTLRDVHLLASAYGWSETDILALSPWRRRFYLELIYG